MSNLAPVSVWRHFASLCSIPRPSKQEAAVRQHLIAWAKRKGFAYAADRAGNLVIRQAATPGREGHPGVILQGHLDMVCQANAGIAHDFTKDPIKTEMRDGWLVAVDTTLGADNGIGVALALAILEEPGLSHPPLELLFTVDEEVGMGGAHGLEPGYLQGRRLLNLDSEEWGEFYLGCAGGCDVEVSHRFRQEPVPDGHGVRRIVISGLKGGHSGGEIHLGRGNANKLLVRVLRKLQGLVDLRLAGLSGGTARNALPREAEAIVSVPAASLSLIEATLAEMQALFRAELRGVDDGVVLSLAAATADRVIGVDEQKTLLAALHAAPHGVRRMSAAFANVVETSNNLGVFSLEKGIFSANLMVRSLRESGTETLADEISALFGLAGFDVEISGNYPGWEPNPHSPLLALCQEVYLREFGEEPRTQVIHAGLECGVIGAKYPGLDAISFGPTIRGAHAPGERVDIASVERIWVLLKAILAAA